MLRSLTIRDFVIVERLEIEFAEGFTCPPRSRRSGR